MQGKTICVIGTLDTKGDEFLYLKTQIEARKMRALVIDCGITGKSCFCPDINANTVAAAAGYERAMLAAGGDPGSAVMAMSKGVAALTGQLFNTGAIQGVIAMGGGQGTCIGSAALRELPFGFPKVLVSTIAMLDKTAFTGLRDTLVMDPVLDISGLNSLLMTVIENAASAVCGMAHTWKPTAQTHKLRVAISMFGITTACASLVSDILKDAGYEPLLFHANGIGGKAMDDLVEAGEISAVVDLTLTEIGQRHLNGLCAGSAERMEPALRLGIPVVVVPGAVDCVNFSAAAGIPESRQAGRLFHAHNNTTILMRTNIAENREIGALIARKVNLSHGNAYVFLPQRGISAYDKNGERFFDPEADEALFASIRENLRPGIPVKTIDCHINDPEMASALSGAVIEAMAGRDLT